MKYYLLDGENVVGPIALQELVARFGAKQISADSLVCEEGTEEWVPLSTLGLNLKQQPASSPPKPVPSATADKPRTSRLESAERNQHTSQSNSPEREGTPVVNLDWDKQQRTRFHEKQMANQGPLLIYDSGTAWSFAFGLFSIPGAIVCVVALVKQEFLLAAVAGGGAIQCLFMAFFSEVIANVRYLLNQLVKQGQPQPTAGPDSARSQTFPKSDS